MLVAMMRSMGLAMILLTVVASGVRAQSFVSAGTDGHVDLYAHIQVAGFATPVELRQSGAKMRMDVTTGGILQTFITDRDKGILITMTATGQNRVALVFPLDRADGIVPLPVDFSILAKSAAVKAVGASMVAGRSCRLMEFSNYLGQAGMVCVSADNVILQMTKQGKKEPLFQVTDIVVAKQDPQWFRTPPDYQVAVLPAIGGASASTSALAPAPPAKP